MAIRAIIFDLDGVLTDTARIHAAAWKGAFDPFLARWYETRGEPRLPFDANREYRRYIDGRPRYQGAAAFIASRGIEMPFGDPSDPPGNYTVCALANEKNRLFRLLVDTGGVPVDRAMVQVVEEARRKGIRTAIATSSRNGRHILEVAGIDSLFDKTVDGKSLEEQHLRGKPNPDMFRHAAELLGVDPHDAAVIEDAAVGIEAAVRGGFAAAIGVSHHDAQNALLMESGATAVIRHPGELLPTLGIH